MAEVLKFPGVKRSELFQKVESWIGSQVSVDLKDGTNSKGKRVFLLLVGTGNSGEFIILDWQGTQKQISLSKIKRIEYLGPP